MSAPRICIAGVDEASDTHIRPISGKVNPLTRDLLSENGGPVELGGVVDLGEVKPAPGAPETEDHWFWPDRAKLVGALSPDDYLALIDGHCVDDITEVFGEALIRHDWNWAVDEHEGEASLGCLRVHRRPDLQVNEYGSLRLRLNDPEKPAFLSVTDLRFVEDDHSTLRTDVIDDVRARMRRGVHVRLMVGLARPYQASRDDRRRHWVQVNGICMEDNPLESP